MFESMRENEQFYRAEIEVTGRDGMEYITVQQAAKRWKISERRVQKYCAEGRIDGLCKFGKSWGIPVSAVKPQDPRRAGGSGLH